MNNIGRKEAEAWSEIVCASCGSLLVVLLLLHVRMRDLMLVLVRDVLRSVLLVLMCWVYHRLNARHSLLLRRIATWVEGGVSVGHTGKHVRGARLFIDVRDAYAAVFFVVGRTIVLLLLRGPSGLGHVLEALLHALLRVSMQFKSDKKRKCPTFCSTSSHFSPTRAARILHISRRTSMYACERTSSFTPPSHCSAFWRSINRSCLLRQAFGDLEGKCFGEIWFQFSPCCRAWIRIPSSLADHEEHRVPPPAAELVDTELRCDEWTLSILGMMIM